MILIEIYLNELELLIKAEFPAMVRVGEALSIFNGDYFTYYIIKKVWYRIQKDTNECVPCAEVAIDD